MASHSQKDSLMTITKGQLYINLTEDTGIPFHAILRVISHGNKLPEGKHEFDVEIINHVHYQKLTNKRDKYGHKFWIEQDFIDDEEIALIPEDFSDESLFLLRLQYGIDPHYLEYIDER